MLLENREQLTSLLITTAGTLDIPHHIFEDAILKYEDIREHLVAKHSELAEYFPEVYVQGSFLLGTVVKPVGREGEYDIDLVCLLQIQKEDITQEKLKDKVGDRLRARKDIAVILESSRRCWVLNYPKKPEMPGFHMDVLPAIPNEERQSTGILLTDTELRNWQKSNPLAYAEWFKQRMRVVFMKTKTVLAQSLGVEIEEVSDWQVKTPLQRCVQLLKRHRDIYFYGDKDSKPVSIVITTLAGHAYENETDIQDALDLIIKRMPRFIENRNGKLWVQNPVDENENFADKWNEYPERCAAFIEWLAKVKDDFSKFSRAKNVHEGIDALKEPMGSATMAKVASDLGASQGSLLPGVVEVAPVVPKLGNTDHALKPEAHFQLIENMGYQAKVFGDGYRKIGRKKGQKLLSITDNPVSKEMYLKFRVETNVPEPYSVQWQVTNTGDEARRAGGLRGDFYSSEDSSRQIRWEHTKYRGTHWVKAFIINQEGKCVAQSREFLVKIR